MTENVFDFYLKQIANLLQQKKFQKGLDAFSDLKLLLGTED